ncbi:MAG: VWA domain-containing protein [Alphaproteobacteria bacterium]|nr:VWA domain-containing protein [Alphaproteobacteria bacterium]
MSFPGSAGRYPEPPSGQASERDPGSGPDAPTGRIPENIMHFVRTLRAAGLPLGPGHTLRAVEAVRAIAITDRRDFYWALRSSLISRHDQIELFDQAYQMFWRNPDILNRMIDLMLPTLAIDDPEQQEQGEPLQRRLAEAMMPPRDQLQEREEEQVEIQADMTWSAREQLQTKDFEQMSTEELERAKQAMTRLALPLAALPTRRYEPTGRIARADLRRTMQKALRGGGDAIPLQYRRRKTRPPPLVVLCDISGSMERYARMLLHFLHALTNDRDRVHTFLFGTRLTNVTRYLRDREVDRALAAIGERVQDWSGGTRIGASLETFNRLWSRRVLGQGAVVLLITDGLDREAAAGVAEQMQRLHKSCRRLIWLNPLLRYDAFQPKSTGARAILPHVDDFRPVHNLESLGDLAGALSASDVSLQKGMREWRTKL